MKILFKTAALSVALLLPFFAQAQDWKTSTKYDKKTVKEQLTKRFTQYVTFDTQSNDKATSVPSTLGQKKLAKTLAKELKKYGVQNVKIDEYSIVTGKIPANSTKNAPVIGFLAHMDTALEASGKDVKPQVHKNYNGGDIVVNADKKLFLNNYNSPQLAQAKGHDIITASGGTLLGADDKTGIAIIMTAVQYLYDHPEVEHGTVKIAFTPDEEIGTGAEKFNISAFGADYAYTVDGGNLGEMITETFNAKSFTVIFEGNRAIHPGAAYGTAFADNVLMASDFHTLLPRQQRPETTTARRGFILTDFIETQGDTTAVKGIIRSFTDEEMTQLVSSVQRAFNTVKAMNPNGKSFSIEFKDQYKNMKTAIPESVVNVLEQAMKVEEITPSLTAARGGTDGSTLSFMGLPSPDIFAGMYNIHSELEYADVDVMEASVRTVLRSIMLWNLQPAPERSAAH